MNAPSLDLRLLVVFDAIMRERSVSAAGQRLGMSQPAVSNALNRLRLAMKDQLFMRTAAGMSPTPRAVELSIPIAEALDKIETATQPRAFSPTDANSSFNLALSHQAMIVVLPLLLKALVHSAPRIRLRTEPKWNKTVRTALDVGAIDFAIGFIPDLPKRFAQRSLFEDRYVCVMRRDHPLAGKPLTAEEFAACEHLAVRPALDRASQLDETLSRLGCTRNVVLNVSQFLAVPTILQETDLVACLWRSVARHYEAKRLYVCPIPYPQQPMPVVVAWSRARTNDPANSWLRQQVYEACETLRSRPEG